MTVNLKNAMVKNIQKIIMEAKPNEVDMNFYEVDLADAVVQASKSLNKISKISHFVQGQQYQKSLRNSNLNQASATSYRRLSNTGSKVPLI